jgi:hypothetical protein
MSRKLKDKKRKRRTSFFEKTVHRSAILVCGICPAQNTQLTLFDGASDLLGDSHFGYFG